MSASPEDMRIAGKVLALVSALDPKFAAGMDNSQKSLTLAAWAEHFAYHGLREPELTKGVHAALSEQAYGDPLVSRIARHAKSAKRAARPEQWTPELQRKRDDMIDAKIRGLLGPVAQQKAIG